MRDSFSGQGLFSYCPRKWQLLKLLDTGQPLERERSVHLMYGTAVGAGVAELLLSGGDLDRAVARTFQHWDFGLESGVKRLETAVAGLRSLHAQFPYDEFEPVLLPNGAPAAEVGGRIWLDDEGTQDYYVLFIDVVLRRKATGQLVVIECKTTKRAGDDMAPYYVNSPQSVMYSLILPRLLNSDPRADWGTVYVVLQATTVWNARAHILEIEHTYVERANVLLGVLLNYEHVQRMREYRCFPKQHTGECMSYNRLCEFFGVCDHLALTCPELSVEDQNKLDDTREGQIMVDLHIQELLRDAYDGPLEPTQDSGGTDVTTGAD